MRRQLDQLRARYRQRAARAVLEADGIEPMTAGDLRVIQLALETHERVHIGRHGPEAPSVIAARRVRAKIDKNMGR